ncbi:acyl-CoA dehydrogenase family protein [Actinoplanes oblitus]|uniref:Acyl-CoA dehydrogenase family protein n=1 Tax=Actinoplanes oblitus TaxID=3040509 RepID=A0ABY8WU93_9ACTN|nr:acyl-CoA dehydrogenase family protein [Actinoplanes oblitus]WIN00423.1 acyl-CoA dehydrogenase family protein [Actinoplanes oblitus]
MELTEERRALRDAVRKLLASRPDPLWPRLCKEIGVAGLAVPSSCGGADATLLESHVVLAELARQLTPSPMLGSAVLATQALLRVGATGLVPSLCAGDRVATVLFAGDRVLDAASADIVLVVDGDELSEVAAADVALRPCDVLDPTRPLSVVRRPDAPARHLGSSPGLQSWLRDLACVALSAEQVGAASRAFELTHAYVRQRIQFGRPIGSFQVIQHRLAEAYLDLETATTASWTAAEALAADAPDAPALAAMARVHCSEVFQAIVAEMVQMHGGIAITWEHDAHRYLRRAHADAQLFGAPATHLDRLAATLLP